MNVIENKKYIVVLNLFNHYWFPLKVIITDKLK